jgi:hypothetical protein
MSSHRPFRVLGTTLLAVLALTESTDLRADALVVTTAMKAATIAEVFIEDAAVRVELEVGMTDIPAFGNLLPDQLLRKFGTEPGASLAGTAGFSATCSWRVMGSVGH